MRRLHLTTGGESHGPGPPPTLPGLPAGWRVATAPPAREHAPRPAPGAGAPGPGLPAIRTGLPAGMRVDLDLLARDLARRQHGYGRGNRMKIEKDTAEIRGGVRDSETLGGPLVLWIANRDYANWEPMMGPVQVDPRRAEQRRVHIPRPGHTDLAGGPNTKRSAQRHTHTRTP